jgi:hypothetical protein
VPITTRRTNGEKGSALVEFLLATAFLILPLLFGTFLFGMRLVRANQVSEVCRDAGHMYAYGVDFSKLSSKNVMAELAQGLNISATGGNGVIILSTITFVDSNACKAGLYPAGDCPNLNNHVFTKRQVIGNPSLKINSRLQASAFGTPDPSILDSLGNINTANQLANPTAVARNFGSVISLAAGQNAYVAEVFVLSPDFLMYNPGGISARSIF